MPGRVALRLAVLAYLALLLVLPVGMVLRRTFEGGVAPVVDALSSEDAVHALSITVLIALIAVPLNTVFGVLVALVLVRHRFRGVGVLAALVDLPFALSPVVIGFALILVFGVDGWFGGWLSAQGVQVVYALPGMVLATVLVSLPFVVREVVPVLEEIGTDQEEAAELLGAGPLAVFWRVTLPGIRGGIGHGVVLATARALGEFGAVAVISGRLVGQTETLTLHVEDRFQNFDSTGAYSASLVLALLAVVTLVATRVVHPRRSHR